MANPTGDEVFRSHWLAFPVSEYLSDRDPNGPTVSIEVRTGDEAATIEAADGHVRTRVGTRHRPISS